MYKIDVHKDSISAMATNNSTGNLQSPGSGTDSSNHKEEQASKTTVLSLERILGEKPSYINDDSDDSIRSLYCDNDNHTVDEMIEASEIEEERQLNRILEADPKDPTKTTNGLVTPAFPTCTKTIRRNLETLRNRILDDDASKGANVATPSLHEANEQPSGSSNNWFVTDESSVESSLQEEEEQHVDVVLREEDGQGPDTLMSSVTGDDENTQYMRFRQLLGGIPPKYIKASNNKTKNNNDDDIENQVLVRSKSYDETPPVSVAAKSTPGTPSTVIIRQPLGLATPPGSDYDSDNDNDEDEEDSSRKAKAGGPMAFLRRASKKSVCKWLVTGIVVLVVIFVALVIAAAVANTDESENNEKSPPSDVGTVAIDKDNNINDNRDEVIPPLVMNFTIVEETIPPTLGESLEEYMDEDEKTEPPRSTPLLVSAQENNLANRMDSPGKFYVEDQLRSVLEDRLPGTLQQWNNRDSPQYKALTWVQAHSPTTQELEINPLRLQQKYALAVLYYSTDGDHWNNNNGWLTTPNECDWFVSTKNRVNRWVCDDLGNYIDIDLRSNNLKGSLPLELVLLSKTLRHIRVNGNELEGGVRPELHALTQLERLHVHWNSIQGTVPSELGKLTALRSLRMGRNSFKGTIPWQLSNITNLESLDLSKNDLTGGIPFLIGDLTSLSKYSYCCMVR